MILYTSWYSLLGHALMISRPGYTTFAMRTHTYRRNFVAVCADHNTSLCDDGWFDGSPSVLRNVALPAQLTKITNDNITQIMIMMLGVALRSPMLHKSASNRNL